MVRLPLNAQRSALCSSSMNTNKRSRVISSLSSSPSYINNSPSLPHQASTPVPPSLSLSVSSMALDNGGKPEAMHDATPVSKVPRNQVLLVLRLVAFFATAAATVVMALNKQTKTMVVATIGSTPITATLTAKFQHTPAFV